MRPIIVGLLTLLFVTFMPVFAENNARIKIVYPKNGAIINASSVFIIGNTTPGASLIINNRTAKVYPNGAFVEVVPLSKGYNSINLKSSKGHADDEVKYIIKVPEESKKNAPVITSESFTTTAAVTKDYAIIRKTPDGDRLTPLPSGTILNITAKIGNNYRFKYSDSIEGWISGSNIQSLSTSPCISENIANSLTAQSDDNYVYLKIPFSQKPPFLIEQNFENQLNLKLFGVSAGFNLFSYEKGSDFVKELSWTQESKNCLNLAIKISSNQFWGYKYYYEGNTLVLRLRKPPYINFSNPLAGKIICVDAGHGGYESGAIGPTEVPEKFINIEIAVKVKKLLGQKGAKVIMTRDFDKFVSLYDRVDIANANNAQIILSIHNNSLPDGKNPYEEHGTSSYYYHNQSLPLAKSLQQSLVEATGFNDLGIFNRSFVLTRPSEALAVLVEVGFMIHPDEYNLLLTPDFRKKSAEGIVKGLENFFLNQTKE